MTRACLFLQSNNTYPLLLQQDLVLLRHRRIKYVLAEAQLLSKGTGCVVQAIS